MSPTAIKPFRVCWPSNCSVGWVGGWVEVIVECETLQGLYPSTHIIPAHTAQTYIIPAPAHIHTIPVHTPSQYTHHPSALTSSQHSHHPSTLTSSQHTHIIPTHSHHLSTHIIPAYSHHPITLTSSPLTILFLSHAGYTNCVLAITMHSATLKHLSLRDLLRIDVKTLHA